MGLTKLKILLLPLAFIAVLVGCKDPLPETPKYISASDNFGVVSTDTLKGYPNRGRFFSFEIGYVGYFESEFTERVTWTIKIKGENSGAVKSITGTSKVINESNSGWRGDSDGLPFFSRREPLTIDLEILGKGVIYTTDMYETGVVPSYSDRYILITDFDDNNDAVAKEWYQYFDNDKTATTLDDDEGVQVGVTSSSSSSTLPIVEAPKDKLASIERSLQPMQGNTYLHIEGTDGNGASTFFVGGARVGGNVSFLNLFVEKGWITRIPSDSATDAEKALYKQELSYLQDNLYVNMYINSNGNKTTRVDIEMREVLKAEEWLILTGQTVDSDVEQDKLTRSVDVTWDGWRLVSVKMSNMTWHPQENAGNKIWEWKKFKSVAVGVLAGNEGAQGDPVDANFDFVTLSLGAPFNQKLD